MYVLHQVYICFELVDCQILLKPSILNDSIDLRRFYERKKIEIKRQHTTNTTNNNDAQKKKKCSHSIYTIQTTPQNTLSNAIDCMAIGFSIGKHTFYRKIFDKTLTVHCFLYMSICHRSQKSRVSRLQLTYCMCVCCFCCNCCWFLL